MRTLILLWLAGITPERSATQVVDRLEPMLQANRDFYLGVPHTIARQKAALDYFDQWWNWLQSPAGCGNMILGKAGQNCIDERSRAGACPWEKYYRDPVANNGFVLMNGVQRSGHGVRSRPATP